jgi:hypothetical protein
MMCRVCQREAAPHIAAAAGNDQGRRGNDRVRTQPVPAGLVQAAQALGVLPAPARNDQTAANAQTMPVSGPARHVRGRQRFAPHPPQQENVSLLGAVRSGFGNGFRAINHGALHSAKYMAVGVAVLAAKGLKAAMEEEKKRRSEERQAQKFVKSRVL